MAQGKVNATHELVRNAMNYSAGNIFERGTQTFQQWITNRPSKTNTALSKNKSDLIAEIEKYTKANTDVFSAGCFERDVLKNLNEKQLKALGTLVSKIDYLDKHSKELLANGDPYLASQNEDLGKFYQDAVQELSPYFEGVNLSNLFGVESVQADLKQLSERIPTTADLELVEAFNRIGVNLSLHVNNSNISWHYDKPESSNTIDDMFRFKEDEVLAFTRGYLDKPISERGGKVITPEGLFRVYRERGQQIINDRHASGNINANDKNLIWTNFQNKYSSLSTKDSAWEIGLLTNKEYIVKMAESLAVSEIAHDVLSRYSDMNAIETVSNLQEKLDNNPLFKTTNDKRDILGRVGKECVNCSDIISDNMVASTLGDVEKHYDDLIATLENQQSNADPVKQGLIEEQISKLADAKENLLMNVEFLKNFAMQDAQVSDKEQISKDLQFASDRYWINSNKGEFEVVDRHSGVVSGDIGASANKQRAKDALAETIKARVLAKAKSGEINTANLDEKTKESIEKMQESGLLTYLIENEDGALGFASSMSDMYKLKVSEILFEEGNPFDILAENYFARYPGKSFDDFVSEELPMADEKDGLFDRRSLQSAYEQRLVEKGEKDKLSDASDNHIKSVNQRYGENIVLLDRVLNSLTPEELANFHDSTYPSSAKSALINQKVKEAKRNPIVATRGNKEYENAMAKYNNSVLSNLLSTNLNDIKEAEVETLTDGMISNILQKYIDGLTPPEAQKSSEPPQPEKDQYILYGKLRQSTVDLIKFEKAMKGFSSKELKKRFIKPLLAGLKGKTMLNISEYERKKRAMQGGQQGQQKTVDDSSLDPNNNPNQQESQTAQRPVDDSSLDPNNNQNQQQSQNPQTQQTQTQNSPQKKNLRKRELEASAFLPGSCMIDKVIADITAKEGATSPKLGGLNNLKSAFQCLGSIDNLGNEFSQPIADGTDFRDACRDIAFDICKGNLKDPKEVQDRIAQAVETYNIPKNSFVDNLTNGFANLTPELMNYLFEFSSDNKATKLPDGNQVNKMTLGSKLPRGLDKCTTDAERKAIVKEYMEKNLSNYKEGSQIFDLMVNDIYLNGAESGYNRLGDLMEFDEM